MASLLSWDIQLFQWINTGWTCSFFDFLFPLVRERLLWAPFYLFILVFALQNYQRKGIIILLFLLASFAAADFSSSSILKKQIKRLRPCNEPAMVNKIILRVPCGSGYSFTSSHAANHFAVAFFLIGVFGSLSRWIRPALLFWASLVALAQVYVGVHYPSDVFFGGLLGAFIGFWGARGCNYAKKKW
ncbi:MAG: phosphatase PAP2 family protein [Bacteroidetes bacterium]|nr:phosphatase PAP2 family protein [Bacteroidota bacterium]